MLTEAQISTVGIMLDRPVGSDQEFPVLSELPYSWHGEFPGIPDEIGSWFVVATNPHEIRYFEDDSQALDETNFAAMFGDYREIANLSWSWSWSDGGSYVTSEFELETAMETGMARFGRVMVVSPDSDLSPYLEYRSRLSDYPLLDESAYFERESEAWSEWAESGGLESDTIRALSESGADETTLESLSDSWSTVWPIASYSLDYSNGFHGECSPEFETAVSLVIVRGIIALVSGALVAGSLVLVD